ncbi:uncharacterized protein LOC112343160 [Selaginella moellendorffii]|uniref:uncharacterized protein LOC112343160 n=1 Tax=Selaginella moellendorffii TaxID=88036 RepID=UPI000D1CA845|nr:uncharacterized protein LOC112343160 [Selaginella moellendorffii]|eukprot:XP_024521986.1 uncharacterized protein LOC112343160 [Selaginella moellendorffii]
MELRFAAVMCALLLATSTTFVSGLVKSEQELIEALRSSSRIVVGHSITITKELPTITKCVTLTGHAKSCKDASCYIDAQRKSRHLAVSGEGGRLSLYNLELRNGKSGNDDGGAILVSDGGTLEVNSAAFINNEVAMFSTGGAIGVRNGSAADIYKSLFVKNNAGFGGAVGVSENSKADIRSSAFRHNIASLSGGGLEFLAASTGFLADNTYENNSASLGGATTAHESTINVCGASFIENTGSLEGPNIMAEGGSAVTVCRASSADVSGTVASEDCAPCNAALRPSPGVRGDPHIRGPHGETFDFRGTPDQSYCLIWDGDLQLNMRIMTATGSSTYIRELGLVYRDQTVWLSSWSSDGGTKHQGTLVINKMEMPMESTTWNFPNNLLVSRTRNEVIVEVAKRIRLSFKISRPIYERPSFLNVEVSSFQPSLLLVDGIFGKLYGSLQGSAQFNGRGKFKSLVDPEKYRVADILSLN